jgi:hypothetical protein
MTGDRDYLIALLKAKIAEAERKLTAARAEAKMFRQLYESKLTPPKPLAWWERWLTRTMGGNF